MTPESKNTALHIAVLYAAIGYLWIISTDLLTAYIYETDFTEVFPQTFKGAVFIFVTATALYFIARRYHDAIAGELAETSRLNKLLRMISRFNQELIHAEHEEDLLEKACMTLVDAGGYELAWIGYAESDERKSVRHVTGVGAQEEYAKSIDITWDESPNGWGPTGTAIREGKITVCGSAMRDPNFEPWRELAARHGLVSSVAFPLTLEGNILGALNIYSHSANAFAGKELEILTSLSGDLSYGITSLRRKKARIEAEKAAAESALEYRRIVETSYEGIWTLDRNALVTFTNERMAKMLGYMPEELTGRRMSDFLHEKHKDVFRHNFRKKLLGVSEVCEHIFIRKNGSELYAMTSATPIHDAHGAICGSLNMVTDITARKKAETALHYRVQVERALSEAAALFLSPTGTGHDRALEIIGRAVNTDCARIFLATRGGKFMEMAHEWSLPGLKRRREMCGEFKLSDTPWLRKRLNKRTAIYVNDVDILSEDASAERDICRRLGVKSFLAVPIIAREQNLIGFIEFDTTREKREWTKDDEHALRIASGLISGNYEVAQAQLLIRKLYHAVEQGPASVVITNVDGDIEYVNPKFGDITGYSAEEVIGKNPRILKSGDTPPEEYRMLWETITAGKEWRGEFHNKKKSGELFWESASISPIRNEKGEITSFIGVKEDITERRKWEQSLQEANDKLRNALTGLKNTQSMLVRSEKLASLGKLAAGVAHEIKNPLNIISTSIQLMQMEKGLSKEAKEEFRSIIEQINRAVKITENLQDFARKRKSEIRDIDLNLFLEKTIALMEYEMRVENINIVKDFSAEPIHMKGDEDQLAQVFLNLIGNARDSMNEKRRKRASEDIREAAWEGRLAISTRKDGENVAVRFEDTGLGIPREILDRVFDPFFTTKPEGKGTGLGLAIAYGIIENHGGFIEMESEEDMGASVSVNFPVNAKPCGVQGEIHEKHSGACGPDS